MNMSASAPDDTVHTPDDINIIFEKMSYGPAPEASNVVQAWLDDHDHRFGHFINNKWIHPEGRKTYETKNPATGQLLASTLQGTDEDVNQAVAAAKSSFDSWSKTPGHVRSRILYSIARHIQKHQRLFTVLESMDNGKPCRESRDADIPTVVRHFYHHAGWAELMNTEMRGWKPVGIVAAIVPWNFPLMLLTWKICPALAMGNTVVLKPATYTRLSALLLAEVCAEAGLPPGVFNVITGGGAMESLLATHKDVDKVGFTGSTEIGQLLRRATAGMGKKLSLELGGKSPVIIFETADLDSAVEGVVDAIFFNQGQVCSAGSRLLIQETVFEKFIKKLKERMTHLRLGDSLDKAIDMGAIIDETQVKTVSEYVEQARQEGAEVYQACTGVPTKGLYYPPTLITNVQTVSRVVVEEIFGPVAVALPFRTAKEAISLGNNTIYGLAASVWTEKISLALEAAISLKAGSVWINCHNMFDAAAGFGGYRQSGFGRDGGKEGLFEYVRPSWLERAHPDIGDVNIKSFGNTVASRPTSKETTLYGCTVKIHEPVGVIGIVCPDEQPLLSFVSLLAPAIVRGNVIVIVPSEKYPLLALDMYQVFDTSDLPGGVINILTGDRDHLTKYLTEHHDIQSVWYFGSAQGSHFVEYVSAENVKRTWVNYGIGRDWTNPEQGQGEEFLYHSVQVKNIWIPMGDIYAN
ncbi:hypothetical protein LSH36_72g06038 [Paralvinella palmiformis]|uniref:Aldehyde dehydrogenase domain-containing protein n=1 Tax=Paralvinella palmiformis TaxID=53620 RepID=A0AAD9K2X2_9ANNE|nr:hypothetical protein LSH36_72g06038 [Paralvinella palmiformis]